MLINADKKARTAADPIQDPYQDPSRRAHQFEPSRDADVAVTPHEDSAIRVWTLDWEYEFTDESAVNE